MGHLGAVSMSRPRGRTPNRRVGSAALIIGVAGLLALTACTSSGSTAAAGPAQSSGSAQGSQRAQAAPGPIVPPSHAALHWHSCSGQLATEGVSDCTMLSVPLNYADPGGRHISLALDMVPATAPPSQQQGVLLVNPGGRGGPAPQAERGR